MEFQGELKTLSKEAYQKLRKEIVDLGFVSPVHVWKGEDGKPRILDGHQKLDKFGFSFIIRAHGIGDLPNMAKVQMGV